MINGEPPNAAARCGAGAEMGVLALSGTPPSHRWLALCGATMQHRSQKAAIRGIPD